MIVRALHPVTVARNAGALALLPLLRDALSGAGPALLLHPPDAPPPATLSPGGPLEDGEDDPDDPTVAAVATSGSTGTPKAALLSASALLASASATHNRLGGPGRWLLALPAHHVAGLQVLVRSLVTGTEPVALDHGAGFSPEGFTAAAAEVRGPRQYTALVPTQVIRLLDAGPRAISALAGFDAVLVGGAALAPALRERAAASGIRLVSTYGMSETCGGCVYDGSPLDGVEVEVVDGRIRLGGPVVARGYRGRAGDAFTVRRGVRWFRTDDVGDWDGEQLTVLGRADEVVITGGMKVAPDGVEAALLDLPGVAEVAVFGVDDPEWGQRVVAAIVPRPGETVPSLALVRAHVAAAVAAYAAPRQVVELDALPVRGPGKPDRAALARLAERDAAQAEV